MTRILLFLGLIVSIGLCHAEPTRKEPPKIDPGVVAGKPDGSSFEKAIAVKSVGEEYQWLRKNYPGHKVQMQALSMHKGKAYDVLKFTTAKGEQKSAYFDISSFFGK